MTPHWISRELLVAVHDELVAEHGGLEGIRDINALDAALSSPLHLYHYEDPKPTLERLATRYAFSLTSAHPFNDGNKRTAFFACMFFLEENEIITNFSEETSYLMMLDLSTKRISEEHFTKWLLTGKPA